MSRWLRFIFLVTLVVGVALSAFWGARRPLSEAALARWCADKGVPATYRITALSTDAVTLRDVILGAVEAPDFRADQVDIHLGWSPFKPHVDRITLVRPSLHATIGLRGFSVGSLDRLLPVPGDAGTTLSDINLTLLEGRASLATRAGVVRVSGSGSGPLRNGFKGRFVVAGTRLVAADCAATIPGATLAFATARGAALITGQGKLANIGCADGSAVAGIDWHADLRLPPTLDRYSFDAVVRSARAQTGAIVVGTISVTAEGSTTKLAGPVAGGFDIAANDVAVPSAIATRITAHGNYSATPSGEASLVANVAATRAHTTLPLRSLRATGRRFAGTLVAPLAEALATRLDAAAAQFDAAGTVTLARADATTTGSIERATLTAANGARLVQSGRFALTRRGALLDGGIALTGGGLPTASLTGVGRWQDGVAIGSASVATTRWSVGNAALEASRVGIASVSDSTTIAGVARVSGAVGGGGVVSNLGFPIDARIGSDGTIEAGRRCLPFDWSSMALGDAKLAAGRMVACPTGTAILTVIGERLAGGSIIGAATLHGNLATADFALTATPIRLVVAGTRSRLLTALAPVTVAATLGTRRGRATINGAIDIADGTTRGHIDNAAIDDPALSVRIDDGKVDWRSAGATIDIVNAAARLTDHAAAARFEPLRITHGTAAIANGVIVADGKVELAATKAKLGRFTARHDFADGLGAATLDTGVIAFGPALQPDEITTSLRGIVANVRGPIVGVGQFNWTAAGFTSHGSLRVDTIGLATEALGPIDGIAGTIVFDDLLALTTPPGQMLRIGRINPGVIVDDGIIKFRMLGPDIAAIDSIRWPYAGGLLALAPVTIRSGDTRRDFFLTVDGIDAQQFLQRFEIKNLNVTGRFDGRLPLAFDDGHGRIVGGRLIARSGGGLVQYVGEIGSAETGAAAQLAFDALRRLRYRDLTLDLDGDLDGELVTQVHFAGNNEAAATLAGGPLPVKVTGLPFRFGITVRAPFRALLGTAASFSDVRPLLRTPSTVHPK